MVGNYDLETKLYAFCVDDCPYKDLKNDQTTLYSDQKIQKVHNRIYCAHTHVCEMWSKLVQS